jgi:hypothetical protein
MVRQLARLRELQGRGKEAGTLRAAAKTMATETMDTMLGTSPDKTRAWWNVVWGTGEKANGKPGLEAHEMRHVPPAYSSHQSAVYGRTYWTLSGKSNCTPT